MAKPTGDPHSDMFTMIGVMIVTWAWAENWLALSIGIIDDAIPEVRGHPERPISLKKRMSYMRAVLRDIPALEVVKDDGHALIKRFMELSGRRHQFVHGSLWLMPEGGFKSDRLVIKGREYTREEKRVEIGEVVHFVREVKDLAHLARDFNMRLIEIFDLPD
jgi:hypothetical protein